MNKEEIKQIIMSGNTLEYSHCIIVCDTFEYEDYPVYVKHGEDIYEYIKYYNDCNRMSKIMEIYNYNLDLDEQLKEIRAYHIEPLNRGKKDSKFDTNETKIENIKNAIEFAINAHKGQTRLNGDPYIKHPLNVALNVITYKKSKNIDTLIISAILHDTIEDTKTTYSDILKYFGKDVADLVLELTNDEYLKKKEGKQKYLSKKMTEITSWACVIKLCDRLDNVMDLSNCNDERFINNYINETIGIIDYLLKNAKLTITHINIIKQILCELHLVTNNIKQKEIISNINNNSIKKKKY